MRPEAAVDAAVGRGTRRVALALCVLSGLAALVYEVVWMRALTFVFGVSAHATATVLCAFMAGLAVGSWAARARAAAATRPLRLYALLEAGIGLWSLLLPWMLEAATPLYAVVHRVAGGHPPMVNGARFLIAGALLFVPAALMGATVPVLARVAVRRDATVGADLALLYGLNTLGAVLGTLIAGFVLLGPLGMMGTTLVAAAVNAVVALVAWRRGSGALRPPSIGAPAGPGERGSAGEAIDTGLARLLLAVSCLSGFTALGWEVLWTRLLVFYVHNSTYAFSAMLAIFLFGLAAGSLLVSRAADRVRDPARAFGTIQVGIAMAALAAVHVYTRLPEAAGLFTRVVPIRSVAAAWALVFLQAGLIMLPSCLLMGAAFPLAARALAGSAHGASRGLATLYAVNTLGTVGGALITGFVLVPLLGLGRTATALVLTSLLAGAALWRARPAPARPPRALRWVLLAALAVAAPIAVPTHLFRDALERRFGRVLYYKDQATDTVAVAETRPGLLDSRTIFYADGRGTAGIFSAPENRVSGHLPMLLHPDPQAALVICFGVGNSLAAVGRHPAGRIHCVELSPGVVEAAPLFQATNRDILSDPRVRLTVEDGRTHLLSTDESYDVVTLEPPEMHTAGVVNLYTREFYELVRRRLRPGAVVCQWLNIRKMEEREFRMLLAAFRAVFPHTTLWQPPKCFGVLLVGTDGPLRVDLPRFLNRFADPRVRGDLQEVRLGDPLDFLSQFLMGEARTAAYTGDARPVTDDRTWVDFAVPRSVAADFAVAGFFAGLNIEVRDAAGGRTSAEVGYGKIARLSRERDTVLDILDGLPADGAQRAALVEALNRFTDAKRPACDAAAGLP